MKQFRRMVILLLVLCLVFGCTPPISVMAAGNTKIQDLQVDQRTNPLGIDNRTPEFRWEMVSDIRGQKQTAYQIVVTNDADETVWDSGKVTSDCSIAIPYEGRELQSATRYTWTVTVWDKDGVKLSPQSAWFETGLLEQSDWQGVFIAAAKDAEKKVGDYTIDVDFKIEKDGAGIIFGGHENQYLMWQVNVHDFTDQNPEYQGENKVYFRPHSWAPGGACLEEIDISNVIPWEKAFDKHHLKIEVTGTHIKTFIDDQLIWETEHTLAAFGNVGFRQFADSRVQEQAVYDNLVVTETANNEILYQNDFEDHRAPFTFGELKDGGLFVKEAEGSVDLLQDTASVSAPMFRKKFAVNPDKKLASARLYATCLGIYEAYINGQKVGVDKLAPGWTDYEEYVQYQTYDITKLLQPGDNAVGAIVGNGWYSGHVSTAPRVNRYGVDEAFLGQIHLTYTDGTEEIVGTDTTWSAYVDGPYVETCNQNGETYDATKEVPGWCSAAFDDSQWKSTIAATKTSIDTKVDPEKIRRVAQPEEPVQVIEERAVTFVAETEPGVYVYDLGQNISGWVRIHVRGQEGQTVRLRYGEMLYKDTNKLYTDNLRSAKATDYYTMKGDPNGETYEPCFTFHGFRYVEVSGLDYQPAPEDITGLVVHSKLDRTGWFETNNSKINQLFSNITWGQRDNYLSIPTDCPQRDERLGWTGDAQAFSRTASLNFDIDAFYTKYLRDVEAARNRETGAIYDIAPAKGHEVGEGNHGWGDVAVVAPWTLYTAYGDKTVLVENWEMMTEWIAYYQNKAGEDLLLPSDSYGDWLSIGESTPKVVTAEAYFAYSTSLMAKMARVLGKDAEAAQYDALFQQIRKAFNEAYVNQETGVIHGDSQTAYLVALRFDLLPTQELRNKAAENLLARLEANDMHLTTGFLGVSHLLPVLCDCGYSDVAYKLFVTESYPSWLYSVVNGATTVWERWNSYIAETGTFGDVGMNSFNHYAYGSVGEWMYQYAAGINYDEANPGYKHIIIRPVPSAKLNEVRGEYESVYGRIVSDGTLSGNKYCLNVTIPANTTATVYVPSYKEEALTVDGVVKGAGVNGVTYVGTENNTAQFEIVSGTYTFTSSVDLKEKVSVHVGLDETAAGQTFAKTTVNGQEKNYLAVNKGTEVTVQTEPVNKKEFEFDGWSGDITAADNPLNFKLESDTRLKAHFRYTGMTNLARGKSASASTAIRNSNWHPDFLVDGLLIHKDGVNGHTSDGHQTQDENEWIVIDLGKETSFDTIQLYPRTDSMTADGKTASFPLDFTLQVSDDGKDYTTIVTETDYKAPYLVPASFEFEMQNARYIKLDATKLGNMAGDDTVYRLQLAEFGVYNSKLADKTQLQKLYDDNRDRQADDFTEESWKKFSDAMEQAKKVLENDAAVQQDVDAAEEALRHAIDNLQERPSTPDPDVPPVPDVPHVPERPSKPEEKPVLPFVDVAEHQWYYDSVYSAWEQNLINGMDATHFAPDSTLTVAQAIKLAAATHQRDKMGKVTLQNGTEQWYTTYVNYAITNGIIEKTYADYTVAQMNAAITRSEFVHIFHGALDNYSAINEVAENAIPDVKMQDKHAAEIYKFYRAGILTGSDEAGAFYPNTNIKRSEVATILVRMFDTSARERSSFQ